MNINLGFYVSVELNSIWKAGKQYYRVSSLVNMNKIDSMSLTFQLFSVLLSMLAKDSSKLEP